MKLSPCGAIRGEPALYGLRAFTNTAIITMIRRALLSLIVIGSLQTNSIKAASALPEPGVAGTLVDELSWLQAEATVFSAARHEQKVSSTAAAVFVLTNADIKRSGATSIPDALRMVPGLDVAQINANVWAVSSRGFNSPAANKLLVLMDGRTIYHPLFSGTLWRTKDTLLEDVERIEVIRGPGAAMWGSNAVNGVINIITKSAKNTQGLYVTGGAGNQETGFGALRYGGQIAEHIHYKGYIKHFNRDNSTLVSGGNAQDGWANLQGGFKIEVILRKKILSPCKATCMTAAPAPRKRYPPQPSFMISTAKS